MHVGLKKLVYIWDEAGDSANWRSQRPTLLGVKLTEELCLQQSQQEGESVIKISRTVIDNKTVKRENVDENEFLQEPFFRVQQTI